MDELSMDRFEAFVDLWQETFSQVFKLGAKSLKIFKLI